MSSGWQPAYHTLPERRLVIPLQTGQSGSSRLACTSGPQACPGTFIEGNLPEMLRFRLRMEALDHRSSASAFWSTASLETSSTSPASISAARCSASHRSKGYSSPRATD
jgi:hypothetical protein